MRKEQQGYLLILASFLLVVGALIAGTVAHLVTNEAATSQKYPDPTDAFYIANSGIERVMYNLTTNTLADKIACSDITGNVDYTNITVGNGEFTVTGTASRFSSSTLSAAINDTDTVIPVSSLTNYTKGGQVMLGAEAINYQNSSTVSGDCAGSAPCLLGATRGVNNTLAVAHNSGVNITQDRCHLVSTAGVPDLTNPRSTRIISADFYNTEQGFIIGEKNGSNETTLQWDGTTWVTLGPSAAIPNVNLNDIAMLNYSDGWIVGDRDNAKALLLHWDGSSWSRDLATGTPNKDLNGVACATSDDCWAVGNSKTFLHWDGTSWNSGTLNGNVPNSTYTGVSCVSSNDCWAVGTATGPDSVFVHWNGTQWAKETPGASVVKNNLSDIDCTASDNCWAVGAKKTFNYWDGVSWENVTADAGVPSKTIESVSCISNSDCWAVGIRDNSDALFVHWDGSNWYRVTPDATVATKNMNGVHCVNTGNCWAVGDAGTVAYWDGSTWTDAASADVPNVVITAEATLGLADHTPPILGNWVEE